MLSFRSPTLPFSCNQCQGQRANEDELILLLLGARPSTERYTTMRIVKIYLGFHFDFMERLTLGYLHSRSNSGLIWYVSDVDEMRRTRKSNCLNFMRNFRTQFYLWMVKDLGISSHEKMTLLYYVAYVAISL